MPNSNPYDSKLMAALRDEERFDQEHQRGQRTVKLEKGTVWTVRFLPAKLGQDETWYARIARHWVNKKPIICPADTAEAFGGNRDMECPCCFAASEINKSSDENVSKFGWNCRANSQRLTFCIVIDKDGEAVAANEMLMAYEFWHYQNTWDELKAFFKAGTRGGKNMNSVLDYKTGNDFAVSRTAKGIRLDKQDSAPIFDLEDPNFDSHIKKVEDSIKPPKVKIPTMRELEIFAQKIEEEAEKLGKGGNAPARGRRISSASDEDIESNSESGDAEPSPRRGNGAPALPAAKARRPAPPVEEPEQDDSNPELMPARTAPAPATRRAAASQPRVEEEQPAEEENPPARPHTTIPRSRQAPAAAEESPDPDADIAPEPAEQEEQSEEAPARAAQPARGTGVKRASTIPPREERVDDNEEILPEESTDQAPPVRQPLRKAVTVAAPVAAQEENEAPPAPARKTGMGSALRDKVRQAASRE